MHQRWLQYIDVIFPLSAFNSRVQIIDFKYFSLNGLAVFAFASAILKFVLKKSARPRFAYVSSSVKYGFFSGIFSGVFIGCASCADLSSL
jgi:hypothetical protein